MSKNSESSSNNAHRSSGGTGLLLGAQKDKNKDIRSVTKSLLSRYSCLVQNSILVKNEQVFVFFLPMFVLQEQALSFKDFRWNDPIAEAFHMLFTLYLQLVTIIVRRIVSHYRDTEKVLRKQQAEEKRRKEKDKLKANKRRQQEIDISDQEEDEGGGDNDSNHDEEDEEEEDESREDDDEEKNADRERMQAEIARKLEDDYTFFMEAVLHQSMTQTGTYSKELKDRKVVGYRFWFINRSEKSMDNVWEVLFGKIQKQKEQQAKVELNKSNDSKKFQKNYEKYYGLYSKTLLAKCHGIVSEMELNDEEIIKNEHVALSRKDALLRASYLFHPMHSISHSLLLSNITIEFQRGRNYFQDPKSKDVNDVNLGTIYLPNEVRKFCYRFTQSDVSIDVLYNRMLPHRQVRTVAHLAKALPSFIDHLQRSNIKNPNNPSLDEEDLFENEEEDDEEDTRQREQRRNEELLTRRLEQRLVADDTQISKMDFDADKDELKNRLALKIKLNNQFGKPVPDQVMSASISNYKKVDAESFYDFIKSSSINSLRFETSNESVMYQLTSPYTILHEDSRRSTNQIQIDLVRNRDIYEKEVSDVDGLRRKLFLICQKKTLEDYASTCLQDLSPSGEIIVEYTDREKLFLQPNARVEKTHMWMTPFQQFELSLAIFAEHVYGVNDKHALFSLMMKNCYDAYRVDYDSLHMHILLQSNDGHQSKSYLQSLMNKQILIPNSSHVITYQSMKSKAVDGNLNDSITFFDEMPLSMIDSKNGGESERMLKQLLSANVLVADVLVIQNGERMMKRIKCEAIGVFIANMNTSEDIMSKAMLRRWHIVHCDEQKDAPRSVIEMCAKENLSKKITGNPYGAFINRRHRLRQVLIFHIEKLIYTGALHQVSMDVTEVIIVYIANELHSRHFPEQNPSVFDRIRTAARANCLIDALLCNWLVEGAEFCDKPIEWNQFARLDLRLWINSQHVVTAIADHFQILIDPIETIVKKAFARIHEKQLSKNAEIDLIYSRSGSRDHPNINPTYLGFELKTKFRLNSLVRQISDELRDMPDVPSIPSDSFITSILIRWSDRTRIEGYEYIALKTDTHVHDQAAVAKNGVIYTYEYDINGRLVFYRNELHGKHHQSAVIRTESGYFIHRDFIFDPQNWNPNDHISKTVKQKYCILEYAPVIIDNGDPTISLDNNAVFNDEQDQQQISFMRNNQQINNLEDDQEERQRPPMILNNNSTTTTTKTKGLSNNASNANNAKALNVTNAKALVKTDMTGDIETSAPDPRQVMIEIIQDIFSHMYQIPRRFVFDNRPECPKKLHYIECSGEKPGERRMLQITSVSSVSAYDARQLPEYAKFESLTSKEDRIHVDAELDSWGLQRHNTRIGLTREPISKEIFDVNQFINQSVEEKKNALIKQNKVIFYDPDGNPVRGDQIDNTFVDVNTLYAEKSDGYFHGNLVSDLFMDQSQSFFNMTKEGIKDVYRKLDKIKDDFESNPLVDDVDFNPHHYVIHLHPSKNPFFHTYAWDKLAEKAHKAGKYSGFVWCPPPSDEISTKEDIDTLKQNRIVSFRKNVPEYKMIHTHPLIFNAFLNDKISGYRNDLSSKLEDDITESIIPKSRAARWNEDRKTQIDDDYIRKVLLKEIGYRGNLSSYRINPETNLIERVVENEKDSMIRVFANDSDVLASFELQQQKSTTTTRNPQQRSNNSIYPPPSPSGTDSFLDDNISNSDINEDVMNRITTPMIGRNASTTSLFKSPSSISSGNELFNHSKNDKIHRKRSTAALMMDINGEDSNFPQSFGGSDQEPTTLKGSGLGSFKSAYSLHNDKRDRKRSYDSSKKSKKNNSGGGDDDDGGIINFNDENHRFYSHKKKKSHKRNYEDDDGEMHRDGSKSHKKQKKHHHDD